MPSPRDAYQAVFSRANSRLADLDDARCRELEWAQTRTLRAAMRGHPMLMGLIQEMRDQPAGPAWKARVHHTMRRLHAAMLKAGEPVDRYQVAVNAYLDGQTELASRFLTAEILLRPWGEP